MRDDFGNGFSDDFGKDRCRDDFGDDHRRDDFGESYRNDFRDTRHRENPYAPPKSVMSPRLPATIRDCLDRDREYDLPQLARALLNFRKQERYCLFILCYWGLSLLAALVALFLPNDFVFRFDWFGIPLRVLLWCHFILSLFILGGWCKLFLIPREIVANKALNELMDYHGGCDDPNNIHFGDNQRLLASEILKKFGYEPGGFFRGPDLKQFDR